MIQFSQKYTLEENENEKNETDFIKKHFKNALETKKPLIEMMVHVYFELFFHFTIACSRRSDSGEPPLFIAFFTSHRSPLSERLEQADFTTTYSVCLWLLMARIELKKN